MEENTFPKRQITRVEGQFNVTFRTNDKKEFDDMLVEIKGIDLGASTSTVVDKPYQATTQPTTINANDLGVCKYCGAPNKLSMKNKVYCSEKCWLKGNKSY